MELLNNELQAQALERSERAYRQKIASIDSNFKLQATTVE